MTMIDETLVTEAKIEAFKRARRDLDMQMKSVQNETQFPWRHGEFKDRKAAIKEAMYDLDAEIISLERSLRDPEQDAEFRAEFYAEARMLGVHDDIHLYMHTPHEEELFQERIENEVRYGYYSEEDGWVDGYDCGYDYGPCETCHTVTDEWIDLPGGVACHACVDEAVTFMHILAIITNTTIKEYRNGYSFVVKTDDDEIALH